MIIRKSANRTSREFTTGGNKETTLGGQNKVTTDSKYVGGVGTVNGQGGNKQVVLIDCMAKLVKSQI